MARFTFDPIVSCAIVGRYLYFLINHTYTINARMYKENGHNAFYDSLSIV